MARVDYSKNRPLVDPFPDVDQLAERVVYLKSKVWEHEKEYRLLRWLGVGESQGQWDATGNEIVTLDFPAESLKEVVIGLRMSEENKNRLLRKLSAPEYGHVRIRMAELPRHEFSLELVDVERQAE